MQISDFIFLSYPSLIGLGLPYLVNLIRDKKYVPCGNKPSIQPPGWVFGVAWTILYVLLGIASYLLWIGSKRNIGSSSVISLILLIAALNLWWIVFSNICNPKLAFASIVSILLQSIVTMQILFTNKQNVPGWLTLPLVLWLTFASSLSYLSI